MGRSVEYDDSGATTAFFVITPLVLYLVPATWNRLRAAGNTVQPFTGGLAVTCDWNVRGSMCQWTLISAYR